MNCGISIGLACSQFMIAQAYALGQGFELDNIKSIFLICKSADQGFKSAEVVLTNM